ncbi:hypothetical protein D3C80_1105140 [compost metagenome]
MTLQAPLTPLPLRLDFAIPCELEQLLDALRLLPISDIAYEQLARCPVALCDLPGQLDKPYRITCCDDHLLTQNANYDWARFAREASIVQLPWQALHSAYAKALPGANLQSPTLYGREPAPADMPQVLLIGDNLNRPAVAQRWLALARQIVREQSALMLLAKDDSPGLKALQATGAVHRIPALHQFTLAERALAAGCGGVLSLDDSPGADWLGPLLADELNIPLFAPSSAVATETGARTLTSIPFLLSQA